ncbi:hypothetical protein LXL04_018555 [Taraxacum kok-saghyz]
MATVKSVLALIRDSRPLFRNSADRVPFAIHSIFLASGFNLNVTGPQAFADDALPSSHSLIWYSLYEEIIKGWNEAEDNYAFVYSSPELISREVLLKCLVINNQLCVDALASGSSHPIHLELNIDDFVAESNDTNYSSQYKNLGKLVDCINKEVISKLNGSTTASTPNATKGMRSRLQPYRGPSPFSIQENKKKE